MMHPRRRWWHIFAILIVGYALLMTFGGCADRALLHPSTGPADPGRAQAHFLSVGNRSLEIFTARSPGAAPPNEPRAFVLEFCGNGTRAEHITSYIADRWGVRPVEVWVMNYPGFGRSTGPAALAPIPEMALTAYDELKRRAADRPIFVAGSSFGTAVALHVSVNRDVAGIILQSPPPLQRMILRKHGWWNLWLAAGPLALQVPRELNSMTNAAKSNAPAVFLLTGRDSVVPIEYQRDVLRAYAGPTRVIDAADMEHNEPVVGDVERQLQQGINWLWAGAFREEMSATD